MPTIIGDTSPSPARQTRDNLVTQVVRWVRAPSHGEATTLAQDEINNAIRELNMRRWYWALESDDITLVASSVTYAIPTTYKQPRTAELLNSSNQYVGSIGYLDPKTFDDKYRDRITAGDPEAYTVYNPNDALELTLSCPPSAAFIASYPKIRLRYFSRINVFTSNSNFTGPSEAEMYVLWYARFAVAMQTNPNQGPSAERRMEMAWSKLVRDDNEHHFSDWES